MNKTEFTEEMSINLKAGEVVQRADWAISQIKMLNIQISNQNRLQRARDLIDSLNKKRINVQQADRDLKDKIVEAHRTIMEQYMIMRGIGIPMLIQDNIKIRKIRDMLSGADLESEDKNKLARNTQYELFVGVMLAMGGAIVRIGEPDLKINNMNKDIPVAVKRITSDKKLIVRIEEARKQIERQKTMGFIAMNYDLFLKDDKINVSEHESMEKFIESIYSINYKHYSDKLCKDVLGIIFIGYKSEWGYPENIPQLHTGYYEYILLSRYGENEETYKQWSSYFERVLKRINEQLKTL